jgi:hypothetical protein
LAGARMALLLRAGLPKRRSAEMAVAGENDPVID